MVKMQTQNLKLIIATEDQKFSLDQNKALHTPGHPGRITTI
jgi:hypothetical protein